MDKVEKPFLLFGVNPILEKLKGSPQDVFEVIISKGRQRAGLQAVEREARGRSRPVRFVEPAVLDRLVGGERHQGVVAKVAPYRYSSFDELLMELTVSSGYEWIVVLDGLTDPRNFGALLRSAEGAGVRHVVIAKDRSVGVTPVVAKTSAGALTYLKIYRVPNLRRAIVSLKEKGFWAVGLDAGAEEPLYGRDYPDKLVVVLGSEGAGIRSLIRQECDILVSIPMLGVVSSLNVAVAGGIFLYELVRQRRKA